MNIVERPELANVIKSASDELLVMLREANIVFKCSMFSCSECPFNYSENIAATPSGYCGCILVDAGTEQNIRRNHTEG